MFKKIVDSFKQLPCWFVIAGLLTGQAIASIFMGHDIATALLRSMAMAVGAILFTVEAEKRNVSARAFWPKVLDFVLTFLGAFMVLASVSVLLLVFKVTDAHLLIEFIYFMFCGGVTAYLYNLFGKE